MQWSGSALLLLLSCFCAISHRTVSAERPSVYSLEASSAAHFKKTSVHREPTPTKHLWIPEAPEPPEHPCMQLEAMQDTYKDKCFRLECPYVQHAAHALSPNDKARWSYCHRVKPEYEVAVGFTVRIPIFAVPVVLLSAKINVDGAMVYHKPVSDNGYKSMQVSAGIEISVSLASIGEFSFEFTGTLTIASHCDNFSTLWSAFTALLIHDYFKFVRKSDKETAEVMKTLAAGLKDSEDLVERGANGYARMETLAIDIEYIGSFHAGIGAKLKLARWVDIDAKAEAARESRRKTLVFIAPFGPPKESDPDRLPTFTIMIEDDGYEWASIARVTANVQHAGTIAATVQCGDSEHDFGFEVSLQSSDSPAADAADLFAAAAAVRAGRRAPRPTNTPATVTDWMASVNLALENCQLENRSGGDVYCLPGRWWGHRRMHEQVACVIRTFRDLLETREVTGTEVVKVQVPNEPKSAEARAVVSLTRETDIDILPPKLDELLGKSVSLLGQEVRLESKKIEDLGAENIQDHGENATEAVKHTDSVQQRRHIQLQAPAATAATDEAPTDPGALMREWSTGPRA